jgi:transcription initiation factor TFIIH subunit 1
MPPTTTAAVSWKKQNGTLSISTDSKYLFFTPSNASSPAVTIPVADVTNLQQTPESSPKVALKVFVKDESHVFSFTSEGKARKEQEAVTDALRNIIATNKAKSDTVQSLVATPSGAATPAGQSNGADGGQSAAMAIAKAVSSKAADEAWYDDNKLKSDFALQKSLLEANKALQARFNASLKDRPESVSISQFTMQFWSSRLHLLRAHAIEKAQQMGEYNVLPEIGFTRIAAEKDGEPDIKQLNITKEQIKLIFRQYPVVKEAYDENVPKPLDAGQFWQRFFSSRLLKKLKGEKITQQDPPDGILDKYLERREHTGPASIAHVPHFIDLEGNEQNHSQRKGNRPDQDMRPSSFDKVPILRVLNNLSEKMLSHVAPEDGEAHAPIGMDEETFEQLRLKDLAMEDTDSRVVLTVREQGRFVPGDDLSAEAKLYARQDPAAVLSDLREDLQPSHLGSDKDGILRLDKAIGYHTDSDSDSDSDDDTAMNGHPNGSSKKKKRAPINSHAAISTATTSILSSIKTRRVAASADPASLQGLSQPVFDQVQITHNTTTEFLHYFWSLFLSGDPSHSQELSQLATTLDRSMDRINAVAELAEKERQKEVEKRREKLREYERRTGKRRKVDVEAEVGGGRKVVEGMVGPTVRALGEAGQAYRRALEEQTKEMGAGL